MTRISLLALASACSGILLGCAVIGASSIVLANEAKLQLAFDAPRIQAPARPVAPGWHGTGPARLAPPGR